MCVPLACSQASRVQARPQRSFVENAHIALGAREMRARKGAAKAGGGALAMGPPQALLPALITWLGQPWLPPWLGHDRAGSFTGHQMPRQPNRLVCQSDFEKHVTADGRLSARSLALLVGGGRAGGRARFKIKVERTMHSRGAAPTSRASSTTRRRLSLFRICLYVRVIV